MTDNPVTLIDPANWERAGQYRLFSTYAHPQYAITARIDVTRLLTVLKPAGIQPATACMYALGTAANVIPAFRHRLRADGMVAEFARADISSTVALPGGGFAFSEITYDPDFPRFAANCRKATQEAQAHAELKPNSGDLNRFIFLTCTPWTDFTALNNAWRGPDDCIPRIAWGRFTEDGNGRHSMAVSVEVDHALVDGEHVGRYFQEAQAALDAIKAPQAG